MSTKTRWAERARTYGDQQRARRRRWMDRQLPGWRDRRHRRPLVIVLAAGSVAMLAAVGMQDGDIVVDPLWFPGFLLTFTVWLLLRVLTSGTADGLASQLDERERTLRDRYAYTGYQFALLAMIAIFMYVKLAQDVPSLQLRAFGLTYTLWAMATVLPTALLAWNLPDDDPEDLAGLDEVTANRGGGRTSGD